VSRIARATMSTILDHFQTNSTLADPPNPSPGIAHHQSVIRYVFRDHSACTDHGVTTDRIATYDHSVSSDSRSAFYKSRHVFMFANDVTTRVDYVRKHHAGTTEDIVFQCDSVVHRNVILYLYVIADGGCANIDVL